MKLFTNSLLIQLNQEVILNSTHDQDFTCKIECYEVEPSDFEYYGVHRNDSYHNPSSFGTSPNRFMSNPVYDLVSYASSLEFPALKATLSESFPDFSFDDLCPWHFKLIQSIDQAKSTIGWNVASNFANPDKLLSLLWETVVGTINLANSQVFSYDPDGPDLFSEMGIVSQQSFFFYDDVKGRVLFFHSREGNSGVRSMSDTESQSIDNLLEARFGFGVY